MNANALVQAIRGRLTTRVVGSDDESLVSGSAQVLEHLQHRVGHTVDVGQERLGDYCDAHGYRLGPKGFGEVATPGTPAVDLPSFPQQFLRAPLRRNAFPGRG